MGKGAVCCGKLLAVLCLSLRGGVLARGGEPDTCAGVLPFFEMKNITAYILDVPISGRDLSACVSERSCCTTEMELDLFKLVRRDLGALLHHSSRSLQGLLVSTADTIKDHVSRRLREKERRVRSVLVHALGPLPSRPEDPLRVVFDGLAAHLDAPLHAQFEGPPVEATMEELWLRMFPLAYQRGRGGRRMAAWYRDCLRDAAKEVRRPGDARARLGANVQRALEAARVLRQALLEGAALLNATDALLTAEGGSAHTGGATARTMCHAALLRMSYCSLCYGLQRRVLPCAGLCLNVLRGCLTQHAGELDLPWNGYVEAAERLVVAVQGHGGVDHVLGSLDGRIVKAVAETVLWSAYPDSPEKIWRYCGTHTWDYDEGDEFTLDPSVWEHHPGGMLDEKEELAPKLQPFLERLRRSRGFYANLPECLCSDASFAETRDTADCWNGDRVGEYTKTVVASSPIAQKYNPEMLWFPVAPDGRIAELSDQLRHLKQVMVNQVAEATPPPALSLVRYVEGSGSDGDSPDVWDADQEEGWRDEGSGSGDKPVVVGGDTMSTDNTIYPSSDEDGNKHRTGASSNGRPANTVLAVCSVLLTGRILYVANM